MSDKCGQVKTGPATVPTELETVKIREATPSQTDSMLVMAGRSVSGSTQSEVTHICVSGIVVSNPVPTINITSN
jgi:hypothetical protein